MKNLVTVLLVVYLLCVGGCKYDVPLADNQRLPLDSRLLGTWKAIVNASMGEVTIAKYSTTEYSFRFTEPVLGSHMRGYPIIVDGIPLIQLRLTDEHFTPQSGDDKYFLASISFDAGALVIKYLDLGGSSGEATSSAELRRIFLQRKREGDFAKRFVAMDRFAKLTPTVTAAAATGRRSQRGRRLAKTNPTKEQPAEVKSNSNRARAESTPTSFTANGLNLETAITALYLGDFARIRMERESIEFVTLFGSYLNAFGRHCDAYLPANKVQMTRSECATERVTRNGYGWEISRTCVEYREVGTGLYADPVLYSAQRRVDADATRKMLSGSLVDLMNNALGTAMRGIDAATSVGRDMDSLIEMNKCPSPGLNRFQENLRRFAVGETPLLLSGGETLTSVRPKLSSPGFKDSNYSNLINDLITENSRGWMVNRFVPGSVSEASVISRDENGRPLRIRADYLFDGFNGRGKASVVLEFLKLGFLIAFIFQIFQARVEARALE